MLFLIASLLAVFICFQVIWFIEMDTLKQHIARIAEAPRMTVQIAEEPEHTEGTPDASEVPHEPLTDADIARVEREAEFDLRIAKIKEELAYQLPDKPVNATVAESFHPLVHNLPHNSIIDVYDSLPDVEYTR